VLEVVAAGALVGDVDEIAGMAADGQGLIGDGDLALSFGTGDVEVILGHRRY
jgi:hypothetical protein